ncbi:hypothetical protein CDL15_Pgr001600 [Punica granatum]|uniref:NADP-dependent oxidoreductase domain-containing protein n=1 Tax=Punica granatum TaxID=22663 RepID=A0A218XBE7_PUNGR|nr:hypothetical protein CDL15_Pgr001600 [Punica granatum]
MPRVKLGTQGLEALKKLPRERFQVATKFEVVKMDYEGMIIVREEREYVRSFCEASLKRLDVDYIDIYYQHWVDTTILTEKTMEELKKLVEEGKIKYIGLSESKP